MAERGEDVEIEVLQGEEVDDRQAARPPVKARGAELHTACLRVLGHARELPLLRLAKTPAVWLLATAAVLLFVFGVRLGRRWSADVPSLYDKSVQPMLQARLTSRAEQLPFYDLVIMIYMTGSKDDTLRLAAASESWLARPHVLGLTFTYVGLVCADDPDVPRVFGNEHVALVGCRHGYKTLVTKGIEGYRYISEHYNFNYVMKTDVDTVVPLDCVVDTLRRLNRAKCPSFGMGHWYPARTSEVWLSGDYPHGPKFGNDAYAEETGNDFYSPYPSGWAIVWSADIARFLGMHGMGNYAPKWRRSWTVDDAAIGTFLVGIEMCQLPIPCSLASGLGAADVGSRSKAIGDGNSVLPVGAGNEIVGFSGPYDDDVPGPGDLANVQASSLGNCAARCVAEPRCRSFEFSASATATGFVRNCQLASLTLASGSKFADFELYLRQ